MTLKYNKKHTHGGEMEIRTFTTGATRSTSDGKLDYIKGLCPHTIEAYMRYLSKHRIQADGNIRDFDNWKKGIPTGEYLSSIFRHIMSIWKDYEAGNTIAQDEACAVVFNAMGMLRNIVNGEEC